MRFSTIGLVAAVLLLGVVTYPYIHNHFVHPLGQLHRAVAVGNSCDVLAGVFAEYPRTLATSLDVHYTDYVVSHDLRYSRELPPARTLALYDPSPFGQLQLRVRCSPGGRVAEIVFLSD